MSNAVSTINTILMYKKDDAFVKLVDIKDYPDLGSTPSLLETTTLTETKKHTNIIGLQDAGDLTFTCNYTLTDYEAILALEGVEQTFQLHFGDDGEDGIFEWKGEISAFPTGKGVDEVREMSVTISESTPIELLN